MSQVAHQARAYPGFHSIKRLAVFLLPLGCKSIASPWILQLFPLLYCYDDGDVQDYGRRGTMRVMPGKIHEIVLSV